jgi:hypothetical protein
LFLIITILITIKWYVFVVFFCLILRIVDVKLLSMFILATCTSPLEKCLLKSFAHFSFFKKKKKKAGGKWPGTGGSACNPSSQEAEIRRVLALSQPE